MALWILRTSAPGLTALTFLSATVAFAQPATRPALPGAFSRPTGPATGNKPAISKTLLNVELIVGKEGGALSAQEWGQTFEQLGVAVRIRQQLLDDKPEVKEKMLGTIRQVTVIGRLDRSGRIVFPDRAFGRSEARKLNDWLDELKAYGAQGAPTGKPLWGLSEAQFASIYGALAKKVTTEVEGGSLSEALAKVGVPEKYPVRLMASSREWLQKEYPRLPTVRNRLAGISLGTALAILTNEYGLGFRPLRTPDGQLELAIEPLKTTQDVWPVGWDLKLTRQKTAPKLFELVPVELEDVKLVDVLAAVEEKTSIPVRLDHYRIEGKGIDLDEVIVSYPMRQTSWSLLLRGVTTPSKLTRRLQIDELGRPFLWVTTLEPGRQDD